MGESNDDLWWGALQRMGGSYWEDPRPWPEAGGEFPLMLYKVNSGGAQEHIIVDDPDTRDLALKRGWTRHQPMAPKVEISDALDE